VPNGFRAPKDATKKKAVYPPVLCLALRWATPCGIGSTVVSREQAVAPLRRLVGLIKQRVLVAMVDRVVVGAVDTVGTTGRSTLRQQHLKMALAAMRTTAIVVLYPSKRQM